MIVGSVDHRDESRPAAPLRVLIAEDELILAIAMRGQLEHWGVDVVGIATNGRAVFEHCQKLQPDVILMDVRMPETDGIEGTRLVMQHCPTCVIIVTAFADDETRAKADAAGAMGFLSKPVQAMGVMEEVPKARTRFAEFEAIRAESRDVQEALATRALVEAAKRTLIGTGVAPQTAFQILEESAQRGGVSLRAAAEGIMHGGDGSTRAN